MILAKVQRFEGRVFGLHDANVRGTCTKQRTGKNHLCVAKGGVCTCVERTWLALIHFIIVRPFQGPRKPTAFAHFFFVLVYKELEREQEDTAYVAEKELMARELLVKMRLNFETLKRQSQAAGE